KPAEAQHLHLHFVAHVDNFAWCPHVVMAQLADMDQPFAIGADVYEGAEVFQPFHNAGELLAFFQVTPFYAEGLDHGDHDLILLWIDPIDPNLDLVTDVKHVTDAIDVALAHLGDVHQRI